jgi:hypothetical protein
VIGESSSVNVGFIATPPSVGELQDIFLRDLSLAVCL